MKFQERKRKDLATTIHSKIVILIFFYFQMGVYTLEINNYTTSTVPKIHLMIDIKGLFKKIFTFNKTDPLMT